MSFIGNISLNVSFIGYLLWFLPQISLNFKRKSTEGVSMLMYGILCVAYLCDLMYGFGCHMQWQYRTITIVGLLSLAVQHYQLARYGLRKPSEKLTYLVLNIIYAVLLMVSIYVIYFGHFSQNTFDQLGMCTNMCWFVCSVPQIIKNYYNQSTTGLSLLFVCFSVFLNLCDGTSAWALSWDYPSKVGPLLSLIQNSILLYQIKYYGKSYKTFKTLVVNS
jgi:uncharacterized protein with PQ loop repeat